MGDETSAPKEEIQDGRIFVEPPNGVTMVKTSYFEALQSENDQLKKVIEICEGVLDYYEKDAISSDPNEFVSNTKAVRFSFLVKLSLNAIQSLKLKGK